MPSSRLKLSQLSHLKPVQKLISCLEMRYREITASFIRYLIAIMRYENCTILKLVLRKKNWSSLPFKFVKFSDLYFAISWSVWSWHWQRNSALHNLLTFEYIIQKYCLHFKMVADKKVQQAGLWKYIMGAKIFMIGTRHWKRTFAWVLWARKHRHPGKCPAPIAGTNPWVILSA